MKAFGTKIKGFSLIEVLIAIAIVALIAVVSLPLFSYGIMNIKNSKIDSEELFKTEAEIEMNNHSSSIKGFFNIKIGVNSEEIKINIYESSMNKENISIIYFSKDSE